jgi:hypothetical protein
MTNKQKQTECSKAKNFLENTPEEVFTDILGGYTILRNPCEVNIPKIAEDTKKDLISRLTSAFNKQYQGIQREKGVSMTNKQKQAEEAIRYFNDYVSSDRYQTHHKFIKALLSSYAKGEIGEVMRNEEIKKIVRPLFDKFHSGLMMCKEHSDILSNEIADALVGKVSKIETECPAN